MLLKREKLIDELGLPYEPSDEVEIIQDKLDGESRWSKHYTLIFKYQGKFYRTSYSRGATEYQEEKPWEYEDVVECIEVEPYEVIVTEYREV